MEHQQMAAAEDPVIRDAVALLGAEKAFKDPVTTRLDAHDALTRGLSVVALNALLDHVPFLRTSEEYLERATGMSRRTYQRRSDAVGKPLSVEQSNRTWKFAELLARATDILGSRDEAMAWMTRPSMGLDQRRPIDLIGTSAGVELVEDHLTRMDYGVYT